MKLLSSNLFHCLRLFVPSYFGLFTIEFGNLQNPSIIFWTRDKYTNKSYSLTIYKREENKNKRTLVSIESLIRMNSILCWCLVWLWCQTEYLWDKWRWGVFLLWTSQWMFSNIIGKVINCIFHSKLFKTIDAECTITSNLTLLPGALSDDPSQ